MSDCSQANQFIGNVGDSVNCVKSGSMHRLAKRTSRNNNTTQFFASIAALVILNIAYYKETV